MLSLSRLPNAAPTSSAGEQIVLPSGPQAQGDPAPSIRTRIASLFARPKTALIQTAPTAPQPTWQPVTPSGAVPNGNNPTNPTMPTTGPGSGDCATDPGAACYTQPGGGGYVPPASCDQTDPNGGCYTGGAAAGTDDGGDASANADGTSSGGAGVQATITPAPAYQAAVGPLPAPTVLGLTIGTWEMLGVAGLAALTIYGVAKHANGTLAGARHRRRAKRRR